MIPLAFQPRITENWLILSSHFVAGLTMVSKPGFEQGLSDLTTRPSLLTIEIENFDMKDGGNCQGNRWP